ncbi:MAG: anthranilate phosphoribosyltransferase [Lysobacterales bacterium]|nr:MAG: anthranilate phosphoribosyltransferase [Xanthomonadales bacterium]
MSISAQQALQRIIEHREIFEDEMEALMRQVLSGTLSPALVAALIIGLRVKKETVGEITGAARVMRALARRVEVPLRENLVDIVGTGGDGAHSFNISTAAMFVAAACGARVAKHGNRSVSSKSGSADVLEALGAAIELEPEQVARALSETGIGFMFAPVHHPALRALGPVRRELGVRTLFNILGPLTNPADAPHVLLGVFHPDLVGILIRVLARLGARRALVVHGLDGLDELSLGAPTLVGELNEGAIREYTLSASELGLPEARREALAVSDVEASRLKLLEALSGAEGPAQDAVVLNAGAALYVVGIAASIAEGVARAREAIRSGQALAKLEEYVAFTRALAGQAVGGG